MSVLRITLVLSAFLLSFVGVGTAQDRWVQDKFILGTFWDPPYRFRAKDFARDSASFQLARDAYFNLLTGTQNEWGVDRSFEGQKWALRLCRSVGLSYLVTDSRFHPAFDVRFDERVAREVVSAYTGLPDDLRAVMYGYNLGDEPHFRKEHLLNAGDWNKFLRGAEPTRLVYLNLVGSFATEYNWGGFSGGKGNRMLDDNERESYEEYLTGYLDSLNSMVPSFDHYPFLRDGHVRRDYFYNLDIIRVKSGTKPFWAYPMVTGHLEYVDPTPAHLRFMYFCPIAYGAKGLVVFSYAGFRVKDYRSAMIDLEGRPTKAYYEVRQLNLFVSKILGPSVISGTHIGVWHADRSPQDQTHIDQSVRGPVTLVLDTDTPSLLVGQWRDAESHYLFVVNKDLRRAKNPSLTLRGRILEAELSPSVMEMDENGNGEFEPIEVVYDNARKVSVIDLPDLFGGEGRLIRFLSSRASE